MQSGQPLGSRVARDRSPPRLGGAHRAPPSLFSPGRPALAITLPDGRASPPFFGTLGSNALRLFESYTIDFAAMRLDLGAPAAPQATSAP